MNHQNSNQLKRMTISNLVWRFAERCGAQGITFIVSIVLARLLEPTDYGLISLVTIFTAVLQVFVDSGLGTALVQKKNADDLDFSTVFYCNVAFCCVLYGILFLTAPLIASFYNNEELLLVIRVLGLTIVISGLKGIQQAYVSRHLIFKRFFFATSGGTIGAAVIGIFMAYQGYGVWALVAQQLSNMTVDTVILWITVRWRPKKLFSFKRLKGLFSYGWKLLISSLIDAVYNDMRQLIIGKVYSSADLAYYNRGKQFPQVIVQNVNASIDSVLLPIMSSSQDDKARIKVMTRRSIMLSSYIMWPMMFGLMAVGRNLIQILLTDKWMMCLPFLYIFCFGQGLMPLQTANLNAIKSLGRSDLYLKMEIIKKSVGLTIVLVTMNINVFAIAVGSVCYSVFASIVNAFPNKSLIGYSYREQIRDIFPPLGLSIVMALIIHNLSFRFIPITVQLFIQIIIGIAIYFLGSILFKLESFLFAKDTIFGMLKNTRE